MPGQDSPPPAAEMWGCLLLDDKKGGGYGVGKTSVKYGRQTGEFMTINKFK